jgi:hypothetical protein
MRRPVDPRAKDRTIMYCAIKVWETRAPSSSVDALQVGSDQRRCPSDLPNATTVPDRGDQRL